MPKIVYTVAERVEILRQHEQGLSYRRIRDHFAAANPDRPILSITTIRDMVLKFYETGNLDPSLERVSYRSRQLSEEMKYNIFLKVAEDGNKPASRIAQELGISKSSVQKVLRGTKYWPYKYPDHQQLQPADIDQRLAFCQIMKNRLRQDDSIRRICFTDESTIVLVKGRNKQNVRFWSPENPELLVESRTQWPLKLNVWVGLCMDQVLGPFFIEGKLNGEKYLQMLQQQIVPAVRALERDGPRIWFQQDGAPPHYSVAVREYLAQEFPDHWIGRLGPIRWPARSPDLTPLDFGLWPYVKNRLYAGGRIANLPELQARVVEILEDMNPQVIANMTRAFWQRLDICITQRGGHFENLRRRHGRRPEVE